jgi:hypothetical protein
MAYNLRAEAVRSIRRNEYTPGIDKSITLDRGFEIYQTLCESKRQKSFGPRLPLYNKHLKPAFGNIRMDKITPLMVEKQKGIWLNERHMTLAHVTKILHLLKTIYSQCCRIDEYSGPMPMDKVDPICSGQIFVVVNSFYIRLSTHLIVI